MTPPPSVRPPSRRSPLLAGADVGGSHTAVAVAQGADDILGRADGPGAALKPGGADATAGVVADVLRRALATAGRDPETPVASLLVGAAGAGRAREREALEAALGELGLAHRVGVRPDAEVTLYAAFAAGPGIVVNAGTGSIAYARTPDGALHRAGGYGWQMSDEGGGYWIGRAVLQAAGRTTDGRGDGTTLPTRLLAALGLREFDDLIRWAQGATVAQVAGLAPLVVRAAAEGEAVARDIVAQAATELAALVAALAVRFPAAGEIPVAATGGLLRPESGLRAALADALGAHVQRARLLDGPVDTLRGALALAAQLR